MLKLKWSDALADVASDWSAGCNGGHRGGSTSCANALSSLGNVDIPEYSNGDGCGENLYWSGADPAWSTTPFGSSYSIRGGIEEGWCIAEAATWSYSSSSVSASAMAAWAKFHFVRVGNRSPR